jgi:hypothetical protein
VLIWCYEFWAGGHEVGWCEGAEFWVGGAGFRVAQVGWGFGI